MKISAHVPKVNLPPGLIIASAINLFTAVSELLLVSLTLKGALITRSTLRGMFQVSPAKIIAEFVELFVTLR